MTAGKGGSDTPSDSATHPADVLAQVPEQVRSRLVALASEVLGTLSDQDTPRSLRPFRKFTPRRRQQHAATHLLAETETDGDFRAEVFEELRRQAPDAAALLAGPSLGGADTADTGTADTDTADTASKPETEVDPAQLVEQAASAGIDLVDLTAAAFLRRPEGWQGVVEAVASHVGQLRESGEMTRLRNRVAELEERLEKGESQHRNAVVRNKEELARARTETDRVRSSLAEEKARGRRLERERDDLRAEIGRLSAELDLQRDQAERQETATQRQLAEAIRQRDEVRRLARTGEAEADARLYLLIDTAERAVRGLRTELNLIAPESLPRDFVAAAHDADQEPPSGRRLSDPAVLREVLGQPRAHLVVDGYNVTMSSYGDLALEDQRSRLTAGLGALAARTGADVTCVFDGTSRPPGVSVQARGLKVIFSAGGQNADSLIKELVRAEPRGRVVVVASSDREVVDDCRRAGCFTVPSQVLSALVERS